MVSFILSKWVVFPLSNALPIDFVIPWVDGADPVHSAKRAAFSSQEYAVAARDIEQSIGDQRFIEDDELKFCLRSIVNHAPWYRKIWLITDQQMPHFLDPDRLQRDRIEVVDHSALFTQQEALLPVFNTRSILTNVDRLDELSDVFVIGNDDTFWAAETTPSFAFQEGLLNIYAERISMGDTRFDTLHFDALKNSTRLLNPNAVDYLMMSHGFMPVSKNEIMALRLRFEKAFAANASYRFRDKSQFLVEALASESLLRKGLGRLLDTQQMVHFSFELCRSGAEDKLKFLFSLLDQKKRTMFCLNDYAALKRRFDWVEPALERICGAPIASER